MENIIECMDRSNAILLIVSSAFVRSKWCQFEMHLAQYRLIETYRDQLVLVRMNLKKRFSIFKLSVKRGPGNSKNYFCERIGSCPKKPMWTFNACCLSFSHCHI